MKIIPELVVYCGARKTWRVLNLFTGTVYSPEYETREEAENSIEDGQRRGEYIVKRVYLQDVRLKYHE